MGASGARQPVEIINKIKLQVSKKTEAHLSR